MSSTHESPNQDGQDNAGDLEGATRRGAVPVRPGSFHGAGGFLASRQVGRGWQGMSMITGAGFMSGDAHPDVMARDRAGKLWLYPMVGNGSFQTRRLIGRSGWNAMTAIMGAGDLSGDRRADILARDRAGRLWLYRGDGAGRFATRTVAGASGWQVMTALVIPGDWGNGAGIPDLIARDGAGRLWHWWGNTLGTFGPRAQIGHGFGGYTIA